ncbi:magnesium transporter CorA family protein [Amphibiibacter pelophylacis]|uniref:Magnesium transporter CorA family protein n=1 Tax=Amphibiibacter pelophylacis TaxID=1799477 RepID=A0ACC6P011_9BURK
MSAPACGLIAVHVCPGAVRLLEGLPQQAPSEGYLWVSCARSAFAGQAHALQDMLTQVCGDDLIDLHWADLFNTQRPSSCEAGPGYQLLIFRRLQPGTVAESDPTALRHLDTEAVGFALFDRLLLSIHPDGCPSQAALLQRLGCAAAGEGAPGPDDDATLPYRSDAAQELLRAQAAYARAQACEMDADLPAGHSPNPSAPRRLTGSVLPLNSTDLMLRLLGHIVDGFLDLRRDLTHQLEHWQDELLRPASRFSDWGALLQSRLGLHRLYEICEDQQATLADWLLHLEGLAVDESGDDARVLTVLKVRSRDVQEHVNRVARHVQRLEANAETTLQMHFSAQGNRTNDIMRTLTVLTAIFLPLNLLAGIFGMNFHTMPLLDWVGGFWFTLGSMIALAAAMAGWFWRKRYLESSGAVR